MSAKVGQSLANTNRTSDNTGQTLARQWNDSGQMADVGHIKR